MLFHASQERVEYDFDVASDSDPGRISIAFQGLTNLRVGPAGDLLLGCGSFDVRQPKPIGYQLAGGIKMPVDVAYQIDASQHVRFRVGHYDHNLPLVIDPEIVFNRSFGGSGSTGANAIALDSQDNIYVTGETTSMDYPIVNPFQPLSKISRLHAMHCNQTTAAKPGAFRSQPLFGCFLSIYRPNIFHW